MKKFKVTFWRGNPQFKKGGYVTTREIEAKTEKSAWKKAMNIECSYGSMNPISIKPIV